MSQFFVGNTGGGGAGVTSVTGTYGIYTNPTTGDVVASAYVDQFAGGPQGLTIAEALAATTSGQTTFVAAGTYPEVLIPTPGTNLTAFTGDAQSGNVNFTGTLTFSSPGTYTFSNINFLSDGSLGNAITLAADTVITFENCTFINTSSTGTSIFYATNGNAGLLNLINCSGDLQGSDALYFSYNNAARTFFELNVDGGIYDNSGLNTSSNSFVLISALFKNLDFYAPYSMFGGPYLIHNSNFDCSAINNTPFTDFTNSYPGIIINCVLNGGSASDINFGTNVGSPVTQLINVMLGGGNVNPIAGIGNFLYDNICFLGTGGQGTGSNTFAPLVVFPSIYSANVAQIAPVSLTTATPTNITSIDLPIGNFVINGIVGLTGGANTGTVFEAAISTTTGTLGTIGLNDIQSPTLCTSDSDASLTIPSYYIYLTTPTTVYLVASATYTVGALSGYGTITATKCP